MDQITLQVTTDDLKNGLPDNYHDPVCLAMNRVYPEGAPWKCEIFSQGQLQRQGSVWNSSLYYDLDEQTTLTLYAFDNKQPVAPFTAILTLTE